MGEEHSDPIKLVANESRCFIGCSVVGLGFVLAPEEQAALIKKNQQNDERIFPYLGGDELNSHPDHHFNRYIINFAQLPLVEAGAWPDLLAILRSRVKPERDKARRDSHRLNWWQYGDYRPGLFRSLEHVDRCLALSIHSKHLALVFQPTDRVFSHAAMVLPLETNTAFAVLQSRFHETWARLLSSSLEDRLRYAASDCFETFPFPEPDPRTAILELETIGEKLYEARARLMIDTDKGLTKTYNALKDPDCEDPRILELRTLHEDMDRAVLAAYGWSDIAVPPYCPKSDEDKAALQAFEDEVIDRLFVLNAERAEQEKRAAAATAPAAKPGRGRAKKASDETAPKAAAKGRKSSGTGQGKLDL